ncbi:hypothetical protein ACEPAH_4698 [Sanghuangporus vaninii]
MSPSPSPSHATSRLHLRQFVTTTVFADPTALGSHVDPHDPIPVAAIAGGVCGGVVLAVLAVIGWKWWGRQIKKRERRELEKRKAMASRQARSSRSRSRSRSRTSTSSSASHASSHSPSGIRSRRTSSDSKAPSHRIVKFTGSPLTNSPVPPVPPLPPLESISSPRPLKPRSAPDRGTGTSTSTGIETAAGSGNRNDGPPVGRPRADSKSYRPLRPSPLALGSPRTTDLPSHRPEAAERSVDTPKMPAMAAQRVPAQPPPPPSSFTSTRLPRIKTSLSSLTGEARRQSKASSHNSASDQSRHSSAGGSARRWSWWSLINGNGFRQVGPTTGKNRISADTSVLYSDWQGEDSSAPIGYAYSGVDDDDDQGSRERTLTNKNSYVFLDSSAHGQDA